MWASSGVTSPSGSAAKSGTSVSTSPSSGAPLSLRRPMRASCSDEAGAVPELDEHPDDAHDVVGPAGRPGRLVVAGLDPHVAVHDLGVGGVEVGGAVDEPHQVALAGLAPAGLGAAVVAAEHPVQRQRAAGGPVQLAQGEQVDVLVGAGDARAARRRATGPGRAGRWRGTASSRAPPAGGRPGRSGRRTARRPPTRPPTGRRAAAGCRPCRCTAAGRRGRGPRSGSPAMRRARLVGRARTNVSRRPRRGRRRDGERGHQALLVGGVRDAGLVGALEVEVPGRPTPVRRSDARRRRRRRRRPRGRRRRRRTAAVDASPPAEEPAAADARSSALRHRRHSSPRTPGHVARFSDSAASVVCMAVLSASVRALYGW